jgi:RNA polymerase sigma-70 factor (ECF subfamily)
LQEQEAIRRCQAGELAGLGVLFELHHRAVFQTTYGVVRRYDVAEDVTQQVFIRLFASVKRFDHRRPFLPWLHRIAVNLSLDELRRRKRHDLPLEEAGPLRSTLPSPEEAAEEAEMREFVWNSIGALSPKHRAAVVLRYFHGFNEEEMAMALRCRRGTVKSRLHNALRRLREVVAGQVSNADAPSFLTAARDRPSTDRILCNPGGDLEKRP